jgi:hypothetical protein
VACSIFSTDDLRFSPSIVGIIQELRGKLSANFVLLIGAIQALIVAHSAKQDWNDRQSK